MLRQRKVDRNELADLFGLSERRIHQLVREGMPRQARGNYDRDACTRWYIRYLQAAFARAAIATGSGAGAAHAARIRKLRIDADLKQLQLDRERSSLVAVEDAKKARDEMCRVVTARLLAMAPRLAPELLNERSRVMLQAKIDHAVREVLAQLARTVVPEK